MHADADAMHAHVCGAQMQTHLAYAFFAGLDFFFPYVRASADVCMRRFVVRMRMPRSYVTYMAPTRKIK